MKNESEELVTMSFIYNNKNISDTQLCEDIFTETKKVQSYCLLDGYKPVDLAKSGVTNLPKMQGSK